MAKVDEKRRLEILNGNMWKIIIAICAPLFIYNLFNSLYSLEIGRASCRERV